jgi:hypothetical protein
MVLSLIHKAKIDGGLIFKVDPENLNNFLKIRHRSEVKWLQNFKLFF